MGVFQYSIRLTSDAEPGTGLGGEIVNDWVPRDHRGRLTIPASHVKGLMRATYQELAKVRGWPGHYENQVFGGLDEQRFDVSGTIRLSAATANESPATRLVTRTAVGEGGVAQDKSLRTSESIPVDTDFTGQLHATASSNSVAELAWRLSLLSIPAIGGGRNRGCGACVVSIEGENRSPGTLIKQLDDAIRSDKPTTATLVSNARDDLSEKLTVLCLVFRAESPICCPEFPDKTTVITSGFSIPASAIQGAVLTRLNAIRPALANALFASEHFHCWPMQPCAVADSSDDQLPLSVRVSLTHRVAKYSLPDPEESGRFHDEALDGRPWPEMPDGAPLKAVDGVLLCMPSGERKLWAAASMPRVVTAHGVHSDPENAGHRNLFSVDAMAPLVWRGLISLPEDAANELLRSLDRDPYLPLGKGRSVRGIGRMSARVIDGVPDEWRTTTDRTVLIAQSPILLPEHSSRSAHEDLEAVAREWMQSHGWEQQVKAWANIGVLFGWNRSHGGRQRANRVALPGSVIAFPQGHQIDDEQLAVALKNSGVGGGRQLGYGAVCVHPGKAQSHFSSERTLDARGAPTRAEAVQLMLKLKHEARRLPSASQLRAVLHRLETPQGGGQSALQFLKQQAGDRTNRVFFTWADCDKPLSDLISRFEPAIAAQAMKVLCDLVGADDREARQ